MQILNIAGYKFTELHHLADLRQAYLDLCHSLSLKGTILLSNEGINISLAGAIHQIRAFIDHIKNDTRFLDIHFHESYSESIPFRHLKIKLKNEIITLRHPEANVLNSRAPSITPETFKQWLDENRDITILDTRNTYEVNFGTFHNATHLQIEDFNEFPQHASSVNSQKPIVMFCTGGIRCEKAALYLLDKGMTNVYQLEGGILGYFAKVGGAHFDGECFIFDERVSVNSHLAETHTIQCNQCQHPVTKAQQALPTFIPGLSCPACASDHNKI